MIARSKYIVGPMMALLVMVLLTGCYDMSVRLAGIPGNTPPSEAIYISGNFNNWDPGDPNYIMRLNKDSVLEVKLPNGIGEIQYKFTRGDWSTVEKDECGFEIANRSAYYGKVELIIDSVMSWNDLPNPECPSIILIIDSLPENTPVNAVLYLAANFNNWDAGSRYWMFSRGPDGKYYIEVPMAIVNDMEYKITRGHWGSVESDEFGNDIDDRIYRHEKRGKSEDIHVVVEGWKDR